MKTERRHELEKNQLADWLGRTLLWCEENARLLAGAVVGVVIVCAVFFVLSNRKQEREAAAWNNFFNAKATDNLASLESIAKTDGDLYAGKLADLNLADIALNQGLSLIATDREQAETSLTQAKKYYTDIQTAGDEHLQERAELGLARCYESLGVLDQAKTQYEKLKSRKDGLYVDLATQKLAYLEKPATIAFAKWFREQKPKPKPAGTGFLDPNNLSTLPKFPGDAGTATTPAATATPSATPSATPTATPAAGASPSATPTASPSATPTASPSASAK